MTVTRGRWWTGTTAADLDVYLAAFSAEQHPVAEVVHARCSACDGTRFRLEVDVEEGYARRRCSACGLEVVMLDGGEVIDEASPEPAACPCGGEEFEVAVGFAPYDGSGEVCWVYVALRCIADGVLGVYTDWKIDYTPSRHLLDRV